MANPQPHPRLVEYSCWGAWKTSGAWARDRRGGRNVDGDLIRRRLHAGWLTWQAIVTPKGAHGRYWEPGSKGRHPRYPRR